MNLIKRIFSTKDTEKAKILRDKGAKYLEDKNFDEALVFLLESIKYDNDHSVLFEIGGCYLKKEDYAKAIYFIDKALEIVETENYLLLKGVCLNVLGNTSDAIKSYNRVIELNPNNLIAYKYLSYLYSDLKEWSLAVSNWDKLIKLDSTDGEAYSKRGICKSWLGDFQSALVDVNKAIEMYPNNVDFIFNRGTIYLFSTNLKEARTDFKTAEKLGNKEATLVLKDIGNKIRITIGELEPTILPSINEDEAKGFLSKLPPEEHFYLDCISEPRSILFHSLKYIEYRPSFADGYILNIDVPTFSQLCGSGNYSTLEPILKENVIGKIHIELDKSGRVSMISVEKLKL